MDENIPRGTGYSLSDDGLNIEFTITCFNQDENESVPLASLRMTRKKAIEFANHILDFCKDI